MSIFHRSHPGDAGSVIDGEVGTDVRPFQVEIPEAELAELRRRIEATRWPSEELVADRSQGVQLATLQALARYWTTEYDWRKCEARLNALPQFTTEIDGVEIHFIHVRSRHENALPLIMTHGWPGSVIELLDTVGPLTDPTAHGGTPEDAFHLVLPSLPGYGFSGEPTELGWDTSRIARAWAELMDRLGYTRYVAQGGDVGALVTDRWAAKRRGAARHHVNLLPAALASGTTCRKESEQERAAHDAVDDVHGRTASATSWRGHPAADDRLLPAGFTRRAGGLDARPRHGQLLQDLPRVRRRRARGQSHPRHHRRQHHAVLADGHRSLGGPVVLGGRTAWPQPLRAGQAPPPVSVPVGFTTFPGEIWAAPRSWVETVYPDLAYFNEVDRGGHFPAWEEPELFSTEMRAAFSSLR